VAPPKKAPKTSVFWGFFLSCLVLICQTGHKVDTVFSSQSHLLAANSVYMDLSTDLGTLTLLAKNVKEMQKLSHNKE
jgi:hypothetical protein